MCAVRTYIGYTVNLALSFLEVKKKKKKITVTYILMWKTRGWQKEHRENSLKGEQFDSLKK